VHHLLWIDGVNQSLSCSFWWCLISCNFVWSDDYIWVLMWSSQSPTIVTYHVNSLRILLATSADEVMIVTRIVYFYVCKQDHRIVYWWIDCLKFVEDSQSSNLLNFGNDLLWGCMFVCVLCACIDHRNFV